MTKLIDITGKRYGRLLVIQRSGSCSSGVTWLCICDCGKEKVVSKNNLGKSSNSCGCLENEWRKSGNAWRSHGLSKIPEYYIWSTMKARCHRASSVGYFKYGARGITVCDRWRESFENFISDMGKRPDKTYSIERIDNNGNYTPENCKWATASEQALNRRPKSFGTGRDTGKKITFNGESHVLNEWSRILGIPRQTLYTRIVQKGWSIKDALSK